MLRIVSLLLLILLTTLSARRVFVPFLQKIERVKELLTYDEFSISEIAYKLGYSSPAHLSRQFRQTTGFTATEFRRTRAISERIGLEEIGVRNLNSEKKQADDKRN